MPNAMPKMAAPANGKEGLRQRQKTKRRAEILAAGRSLLREQGYAATNMDAIAELAEVGVATVYNYFGTKGGLLAEVLRQEFEILFQGGKALLAAPPEDPVVGILSLIDRYRKFQQNWDRKDALLAVIGPGLSAEPVLDDLAADVEQRVKRQIADLISYYKDQNKVRDEIDVPDAATIIFYIFNQHFIEYVTHGDADYDRMVHKMDRHISFIVSALLFYAP